jgi:hypothetical protein
MPLKKIIAPGMEKYLPLAKQELAKLKKASYPSKGIASRRKFIPIEGGLIELKSHLVQGSISHDLIRISGGFRPEVCISATVTFTFFPTLGFSSYNMNTYIAFTVDGVSYLPVAVGSKISKISADLSATDADGVTERTKLRIAAAQRALSTQHYGIAEYLLRNIAGQTTDEDTALWTSEGFFVDLTSFEGRPYHSLMVEAFEEYDYPFVKGNTAPSVDELFPEYPLSEWVEGTDDNNAHHKYTYTGVRLENTENIDYPYLTSTGTLVSTIDAVPVGGLITHSRMRKGASAFPWDFNVFFGGSWKKNNYTETGYYSQLDNYYLSSVIPPATPYTLYSTRETFGASGIDLSTGSVDGFRITRARVLRRSRYKDGWVIEENTVYNTPDVSGGGMTANDSTIVTPPSGTLVMQCYLVKLDGSQVLLGTVTKNLSTYSYTHGADLSNSYYFYEREEPGGDPIGSPATTGPVYTGTVTHNIIEPNIAIQIFSVGGLHLYIDYTGHLRDGDTGSLLISTSSPRTNLFFVHEEAKEYSYPDAASYAAACAASTINIELQGWNLPFAEQKLLAVPPVISGYTCIYQVSTKKYLYFVFSGDAFQDLTDRQGYLAAKFGGASAEEVQALKDTVLSRYSNFVGTLPHEFVIFRGQQLNTTYILV